MKLIVLPSIALAAFSSSVQASHPHFRPNGHHHHAQHGDTSSIQTTTTVVTSMTTVSSSSVSLRSTTTKLPTPASAPTSTPSTRVDSRDGTSNFVHPGIFISSAQIGNFSSNVASSTEPWAEAYKQMMNHKYASRTTPTPYPTVSSDASCDDELDDALTAYLNALAWVVTKTKSYAKRAITFMNSWAGTIQCHGGSNAPLQSGWAASVWTGAADIIRYTNAGWTNSSIVAFEDMLRDVYLPEVIVGSDYNGNWELGIGSPVMMEAALGISVFIENTTSYDIAMEKFLARTAAYVYLTSDGDLPNAVDISTEEKLISYWYDQDTFVDGLSQETCRDFGHVGYGLASISHVLETSRIQGNDMYEEDAGKRLRYALEFHSKYENGATVPDWLCGGEVSLGIAQTTEPGLNAFSYRLGYAMNETQLYTEGHRPENTNGVFVG
ncbi:hypothetical protein PMG11_10035 [Penicillium brasilianum]|uniref:Alginate lyase domain-containing protein n=1 Tax=Penicillium brasilianum TaxID=104259 RepID=A0A0F7U2H2_PENBI|nr:hypothetical protein PMG11_10035 [Penicillium brasilianum]